MFLKLIDVRLTRFENKIFIFFEINDIVSNKLFLKFLNCKSYLLNNSRFKS